jgi:DASH complex subunit DAD1
LTNVLNRQIEEVFSMSAEYETVANLWNSFHQIVQDQDEPSGTDQPGESEDGYTTPLPAGLPGTGTHIVTDQIKENT